MANQIVKTIDGVNFINPGELWKSMQGIPSDKRIRALLEVAGATFYDEGKKFVKKPQVGVIGVGGLPVTWNHDDPSNQIALTNLPNSPFDPSRITESVNAMSAYGGFMTYLNPNDRLEADFSDRLFEHSHLSTMHMTMLNIIILGVSTAVENEFCCQRDLVHLARLTEARTKAQADPPICILYPEILSTAEQLVEMSPISKLSPRNNDYREAINILHPAAKATVFVVSGSLKNFRSLVDLLDDEGKEEEMKRVLAMANDTLSGLFPKVFKKTSDYQYNYPTHFLS